jgi:hypothetical protein
MLCFRLYALVFLPVPGTGHGDTLDRNSRLVCLRHYRAASDGWTFTSGCGTCSASFQDVVRHLVGCVAPAEPCSCNVCSRQPPSLLDMVSRTALTLTINVDRFRLRRNVTLSEYVYAVDSGRVRVDRVLPPEYPDITVRFRYRICSHEAFHPYCAPSLPWHASATRTYDSPRRQSRSSTRGETCIGVRGARGRCSFERLAMFTMKRTMVFNHSFFCFPKSVASL